MPVTATGPLAIPFAEIAAIIAASETFQTLVDADDATEALESIIFPEFPGADEEFPINLVIITQDDTCEHDKERATRLSGEHIVTFMFARDEAFENETLQDEILDWNNQLGAILNEIIAKAGTAKPDPSQPSYINITGWKKTGTPSIVTSPDYEKPYRHAEFKFIWLG